METKYSDILPAYNYISACIKLKDIAQCDLIFNKYLTKEYKENRYYNSIYFLYLVVHKYGDEGFYEEVKHHILPFYEKLKVNDICRDIRLKLIEYLESKRRYKEANQLYRELLLT